jgi:sugar O-acyltransferase (sialic acid O-acetyltransferase NeuD family)
VSRAYIVGAGAQGRVVLEVWRAAAPGLDIEMLDDNPALHGGEVLGARVAGPVSLLGEGQPLAVVALGNNPLRLRVAALWEAHAEWARPVHPSAVVFPSVTIGPGSVVFAGSVLNSCARLGAHVVVNTGVVVEHDCVLEDGVSVSPGACMGGRVHVERGAFVSTGVTLAPRVRVGAGSVIGAGAVVVSDIPAGVLAYGVPARPVRSLGDGFDWRTLL